MTEAQVKDTTGRFNEVMDLNRASNLAATKKEITLELRQLRAEEASEKLTIWTEPRSEDFGRFRLRHNCGGKSNRYCAGPEVKCTATS
jgi:dynactin 1